MYVSALMVNFSRYAEKGNITPITYIIATSHLNLQRLRNNLKLISYTIH